MRRIRWTKPMAVVTATCRIRLGRPDGSVFLNNISLSGLSWLSVVLRRPVANRARHKTRRLPPTDSTRRRSPFNLPSGCREPRSRPADSRGRHCSESLDTVGNLAMSTRRAWLTATCGVRSRGQCQTHPVRVPSVPATCPWGRLQESDQRWMELRVRALYRTAEGCVRSANPLRHIADIWNVAEPDAFSAYVGPSGMARCIDSNVPAGQGMHCRIDIGSQQEEAVTPGAAASEHESFDRLAAVGGEHLRLEWCMAPHHT